MRSFTQRLPALRVLALVSALGCQASVTSLTQEGPPRAAPSSSALPYSVRIQDIATTDPGARLEAHTLRAAVTRSLRASHLFDSVVTSRSTMVQTDFVLRGEAQFNWSDSGTQNFLTFFPGGLIFAPGWRGVRWDLRIDSTWELLDDRTGTVVGRYEVDTAHELIHPSGNPWHFAGALLIIPGTITASQHARVRQRTKDRVHAVALPALSRRLVDDLTQDRRAEWQAEHSARRDGCGETYDAPPITGQSWSRFRACQSHAYVRRRQTETDAGPADVFDDSTNRWRLVVRDDVITFIEDRQAKQRECGDRLGARPNVGDSWDAFVRCQKRRFEPIGAGEAAPDEPTVFEDAERALRIQVLDGRIVRWEEIE